MAEFIDTPEALEHALAALADQPALALDTETDAFFAYRPAICLIQLSVPGEDLVIDPLADMELAPLGALLGDPGTRVVLHAAENDVIQMQHQFGWRLPGLFDTQVACFVLGLRPYSLAGVLEARFGVKLDKSQQRSDWRRRPLTREQLAYAALDTHYLLDLAADLEARARETGREDEIAYECQRIATREWAPEPFDPEGFRRIAGAKSLSPAGLRVLRELYLFRHGEADARNRAPYRIVRDDALVAIARRGLDPLPRSVPPGFWRRYGHRVRAVVRDARRADPVPPAPRRRGADDAAPIPAEVKRRYERLRKWRGRAAATRDVEPFVVARNELLMKVARSGSTTMDALSGELEPFRFREYGAAMLAAMLGEPHEGGADANLDRAPYNRDRGET